MTNVGERPPRMSEMPIVTILQAVVIKYLKKRVIVDGMDMHCVLQLLRHWW